MGRDESSLYCFVPAAQRHLDDWLLALEAQQLERLQTMLTLTRYRVKLYHSCSSCVQQQQQQQQAAAAAATCVLETKGRPTNSISESKQKHDEPNDMMGCGFDVPASAGKGEGGRSKMRSLLVNRSAISWVCFRRASRSCTAPSRSSTCIACTSFCQTCSKLPAPGTCSSQNNASTL